MAQRLAAIGVDRRDFLKVAGGLATLGGAGFAAAAGGGRTKPGPGEKLAKDQTCGTAAAAGANDPSSHDSTRTSTAAGSRALWAGLMKFDADFEAVP